MDFFERQDQAQRRTRWLVFYFATAVLLIIAAIYLLAVFALGMLGDTEGPNAYFDNLWHPDLLLLVALGTCVVVGAGSAYKISQLSHGGGAVAAMLGARRLQPQSTDLAERRLLNVVEEMALASGVPVPPVYVMDEEPSINAFAAGYSPGDAVIGVSRGALTYLNRDELQGVMAHEFSHVLNGDMRLNTRLTGVLHGIVIIALLGWIVIRSTAFSRPRSSSRGGKGGGGAMLAVLAVGAGLLVIGGIGWFFAKIIRAAVSRQREHLADASAVQFTRNPDGIGGALKKIGGVPATSKIENDHASEVSHMFFCSAVGSFASQLFATHPPLVERIRLIDPSFNGEFPKHVQPVRSDEPTKAPKPAAKPRDALGKLGETLDPAGVFDHFGTMGGQQVVLAAALLEELPDPLRAAAHEPYGARALIYCLLIDSNPEVRAKQMATLEQKAEPPSFAETQKLLPLAEQLAEDARLPLVGLSFPALKELSPEQYERFSANCTALIEADGRLDLLEYTIRTMVLDQLDVHFGRRAAPRVRYTQVASVARPIVQVLSTLAHVGSSDPAEVADAYRKGMAVLERSEPQLSSAQCSLGNLDKALKTLAECAPLIKRQILQACTATVAADNLVTPRERQLLHAVAAMLGVPMGL